MNEKKKNSEGQRSDFTEIEQDHIIDWLNRRGWCRAYVR